MNMLELSKCERITGAETKEEFYLVKNTGSLGSIWDFSNAHVWTLQDINNMLNEQNATNLEIVYSDFDKRIGFHKWHVLADIENYPKSHMMWLLSTSKEHPWLSQCTPHDLGM